MKTELSSGGVYPPLPPTGSISPSSLVSVLSSVVSEVVSSVVLTRVILVLNYYWISSMISLQAVLLKDPLAPLHVSSLSDSKPLRLV